MRGLIPWSFVHLPNLNFDFWRVGALGVRSMGLSVGSLAAAKNGGKALAAEVDKLVRICASQKAVPYTDNVGSALEVDVLRTQGVRLLAGSVIGNAAELPGPVGPLSFAQLQGKPTTALPRERLTGS